MEREDGQGPQSRPSELACASAIKKVISKDFILRIFEGFSIQRWNDLIRPFEMVEMDKAGEKALLSYLIGKYEEARGEAIDWEWIAYATLFDLLKKIALCDIKAPVQQILKKEFPAEYLRLDEWVLHQYKGLMADDTDLFSRFTLYIGQKAHAIAIPESAISASRVYAAAHKYSTMRELQMLKTVNESERLCTIERELLSEAQEYLDLRGLQALLTKGKAYELLLKMEQLRFQTRWNQTPRVPKTSVLGHSYFVAAITLLLGRSMEVSFCRRRVINNFFGALFHDTPEAVTRDIISPVKQATDDLPAIIKHIENEIMDRELFPLMEDFYRDELLYYTTDEFSTRIKGEDGKIHKVSTEEINTRYNEDRFEPVDGELIRLGDHLSALTEADISIKHGITSSHLVNGRKSILSLYKEGEMVSGIDALSLFKSITQ